METRDPQKLSWDRLNQWLGWAVITLSSGLVAATILMSHG